MEPSARCTSASTVGLPRESRISRPTTLTISISFHSGGASRDCPTGAVAGGWLLVVGVVASKIWDWGFAGSRTWRKWPTFVFGDPKILLIFRSGATWREGK